MNLIPKDRWIEIMEGSDITEPELKKYPTLHFCDEWDGLLIQEGMMEFEFCRCILKGNK